jgi:RNA polymerase sigma-70 factor, ECF subfamily
MGFKEDSSPDEDGELVSRCREGQIEAFEALVMKHQKRMLNIAFRMVGNYEDACEVVQDAFLSAYTSIHRFESRSRFSTWLSAIVINASKNRLQQNRTIVHREQFSLDAPVSTSDGNMRIELASDCLPADEHLEKKEMLARIQKCIDTLAGEFKEVLILRDIQGFSYDEIGNILRIAGGTVRSRLSRARAYMKNCLEKVPGE